jgi:cell wall-associated NlpC family hydrolase
MTTSAEVVAEAYSWIGTPWVHQHRTKGLAVDCAGLVIGVARELGLVPAYFDVQGYGRQADGSLLSVCEQNMTRVPWDQARAGDVLVVSVGADPQHMGILVPYRHGGFAMVHACIISKKVVQTRVMFSQTMRFRGAYRLPGVEG